MAAPQFLGRFRFLRLLNGDTQRDPSQEERTPLAMEDLEPLHNRLIFTKLTEPVGSGANHLIYEFYPRTSTLSDIVHHLTITKLAIRIDEINFIRSLQKGYHVGFASPLMASIIENEPLKLGSNENNQKTL